MPKNAIKAQSESQEFSSPLVGAISLVPNEKRYGKKNYILYRVNLPSIEITQETRDDILRLMDEGKKHVQLGEYTVMTSSISGINPLPVLRDSITEFEAKIRSEEGGIIDG